MGKKSKKGRPTGSRTQYREIAGALREQLREGRWATGSALPRIRDLAVELNVNYMVVFRALELLKKDGCISSSRQRQIIVRAPMGFDTHANRQIILVVNQPLTVALQTPEFSSAFAGIEAAAENQRFVLFVAASKAYKRSMPQSVIQMPVQGVLVAGPTNAHLIPEYEQMGVPVVLLDQPGEGLKVSSISVDNETSACDAVRNLAALGHTRIVFLQRVNLRLKAVDPDSKERQRGFKRGLKEAGLNLRADSILSMMGAENSMSACIQTVFKSKPPITAVLCADGGGAALYMKAAQEQKANVPGDLSIAAFQCESAKTMIGGPRINFHKMGEQAVALLESVLKTPKHLRISAKWEPGNTVGPPARNRSY